MSSPGLFERASGYVHCIESGKCPDNHALQLSTLVQLHDDLAAHENAQDDAYSMLLDKIIDMSERLLEQDQGNSTATTENPGDAKSKEAYNDNDPEVVWEISKPTEVSFDSIIGCEDAIQVIKESVIIPIKFPLLFSQTKAIPWKGALLYGPPGTGKSLLAKAAAAEACVSFFDASCASLTSKWVGGSEKLVRSLFKAARSNAPSIIFLDEIDSIASSRDGDRSLADQRLTNQLLLEIDSNAGCASCVFLLAASNLPWTLDSAVMRRLPKKIYVKLPNGLERIRFLKNRLHDRVALSDADLEVMAGKMDGFSGSDITNFVNEILLEPLRLASTATHFLLETSGDDNVLTVYQDLGGKKPEATAETNIIEASLSDVISQYGENCIKLPPITKQMFFDCLKLYAQNVCIANVKRYDEFGSLHA